MLAVIENQTNVLLRINGDHYGDHIKHFVSWLGDNSINQQTVTGYFEYLNGTNYAANTKKIRRQAVKKRLRQLALQSNVPFMEQHKLDIFLTSLDNNTTTKAPGKQEDTIGREKYLTRDQVERLIEVAGLRTKYFIKFLWATGCRVTEMITARQDKCKTIGNTVYITVIGKGNKERVLKVPLTLFDAIQSVFGGSEYVFETSRGNPYVRGMVSQSIANVSKRVLGRPYRSHALRHSFATRKIKQGTPISYVSKYLGHSSVGITSAMYDHGSIEEADLFNDLV